MLSRSRDNEISYIIPLSLFIILILYHRRHHQLRQNDNVLTNHVRSTTIFCMLCSEIFCEERQPIKIDSACWWIIYNLWNNGRILSSIQQLAEYCYQRYGGFPSSIGIKKALLNTTSQKRSMKRSSCAWSDLARSE